MYISGFIVPVPADHKAEYKDVAEKFWDIAKDYGALEQVEAWEADVPDGKVTDFRRSVNIEDGEKVVFSWVVWPDKATADASQDRMMADERMKNFSGEMPFDGKRMVYGGFDPLMVKGRDDARQSSYVTGYVIPVPEGSKEQYRRLSEIYWDYASENGALEQVEAWEADVSDGKLTDFHRAVQVADGEKVVFSWMSWPDKATAKAFQEHDFDLMTADPRMKEFGEDMPFDGRRIVLGGFEPLVVEGR